MCSLESLAPNYCLSLIFYVKHGLNRHDMQYNPWLQLITMHLLQTCPLKSTCTSCLLQHVQREELSQMFFPRVDFESEKKGIYIVVDFLSRKRFPKVNNITGKKQFNAGLPYSCIFLNFKHVVYEM